MARAQAHQVYVKQASPLAATALSIVVAVACLPPMH